VIDPKGGIVLSFVRLIMTSAVHCPLSFRDTRNVYSFACGYSDVADLFDLASHSYKAFATFSVEDQESSPSIPAASLTSP